MSVLVEEGTAEAPRSSQHQCKGKAVCRYRFAVAVDGGTKYVVGNKVDAPARLAPLCLFPLHCPLPPSERQDNLIYHFII